MYRTSILIALVLGFFLLAAGRHRVAPPSFAGSPPPDSLALDLPEEPFDYENIAIPEYLLQGLLSSDAPFSSLLDSITNAGATLGRVLFYERRLSANQQISCGSCHEQAHSFGASTSRSPGFEGVLTPRNTMQINHMALSPGPPVFWDGRIQSISEQVIMPILHPDEMGLTAPEITSRIEQAGYYPAFFEAAFGDSQVTIPRIRSALVQFVVSIASFDSKFDQMQDSGDLSVFSEMEQQGWLLFQQSCILCHIEGHFGTDSLFNIGLDTVYNDPGMAGWTANPAHHGAFKSPTLRNVALSAPYMHDGRFATLEKVIDFYSDEVAHHPNNHMAEMLGLPPSFRGFRYSPEEKEALAAFMHTLTDSTLITHAKWSDPFVPLTPALSQAPNQGLRLRIYPNPARLEAAIEWDAGTDLPVHIALRNPAGRMLQSARTTTSPYRFSLEGLPAGVYYVEWRSGEQRKTGALVVQK